jgi:hemoglobin
MSKMTMVAAAFMLVALLAASAGTQEGAVQKPLFDRLGGLKGITVVVDDFIDRLVTNETLNKNPAINAGRKSSPPPYLKFQVSQLVCEAAGGPCTYTGKGMRESHAHLIIAGKEWEIMVSEFKKSLDRFKVPAGEQKELLEIVEKTRDDIVAK